MKKLNDALIKMTEESIIFHYRGNVTESERNILECETLSDDSEGESFEIHGRFYIYLEFPNPSSTEIERKGRTAGEEPKPKQFAPIVTRQLESARTSIHFGTSIDDSHYPYSSKQYKGLLLNEVLFQKRKCKIGFSKIFSLEELESQTFLIAGNVSVNDVRVKKSSRSPNTFHQKRIRDIAQLPQDVTKSTSIAKTSSSREIKAFSNKTSLYKKLVRHNLTNDRKTTSFPDQQKHAPYKSQRNVRQPLNIQELKADFFCSECKQEFSTRREFSNHLRIHAGNRERCSLCRIVFSSNLEFAQHMETHSAILRHKCPKCPRRFKRSTEIKQHMPFHNQESLFKCRFCDKVFKYDSGSKAHEKRQHANLLVIGQV